MNRFLYPAKSLLVGLLTAQAVATLHVYLSSRSLYQSLSAMSKSGYLVIPNRQTMPYLLEWGPALWGGLFFTLSIGAALSILSMAAAWIWGHLMGGKRIFLIFWLIPWLGLLVLLNRSGFCLMASIYFLLIPPVVFFAISKKLRPRGEQKAWLNRIGYVAPIPVLALLWVWQMDSLLFIDFRDHLLLSNSIGIKVNDFYYKYTLYPAETFKSLDQKTLKTSHLGNLQKKPAVGTLERELLRRDYLSLDMDHGADLELKENGGEIIFQNRDREVLRTSLKKLLADPGGVLKAFSEKTDRYVFFRHFTFYSLLIGFPITLYIFLQALFYFLFSFFFHARVSIWISSVICLILGTTLFLFLHLGIEGSMENKDLAQALESPNWQKRVAALRTIDQKKLELGDFPAYQKLLKSPHIPERYWAARALAVSQQPGTYPYLSALLADPSPNVVTMALYALGQRGNPKAVNDILEWMKTSDHWYSQWYAYNALKALGWKQSKSR